MQFLMAEDRVDRTFVMVLRRTSPGVARALPAWIRSLESVEPCVARNRQQTNSLFGLEEIYLDVPLPVIARVGRGRIYSENSTSLGRGLGRR